MIAVIFYSIFKKFEKNVKKVLTSYYEFDILIWQSKNCVLDIAKIKIIKKITGTPERPRLSYFPTQK